MEIGVFDAIIDLEPFEKSLLHFTRTKGKAITDVVEKHARPLREKPADQESFERDVSQPGILLDGKKIKNISVQDKEGIRAAVPAAGQFQCPAAQWKTRGGRGTFCGRRCGGWWFSFHYNRFQYRLTLCLSSQSNA